MAKVYVNGEVIHNLEEHKKELREAIQEAVRRRGLLWKELKSDLEINDDDHYWRANRCKAMAYTEERLGALNERLEMIKRAEKAEDSGVIKSVDLEQACYDAAGKAGLGIFTARDCNDGENGCPGCPIKN